MRAITSILLITLLALPAQAYERSGGTEADYKALEQIGDAWAEAYRNEDLEGLVDLYTEDAWVMARRQPLRRGHEELRAFFGGLIGQFDLDVQFYMEELVVDDDFAHSIARFALTYGAPDGAPAINDHGRALILYTRGDDGKWRIWRDMDNVTPDAEGLSSRPG